jgi:predicted CXXCH cytochrome family protein
VIGGWSARGLAIALAAATLGAPTLAAQEAEAVAGGDCVTCHATLDGRLGDPVEAFASDVHAASGFGCVACHGGDEHAGFAGMDPAKGFVGRPQGRELLDVCGRCHSDAAFMRQYDPSLRVDQVTEYLTSVHGRRLRQFGDTLVATCSSCHPAHQIRPPSDPRSTVHPLNVAATCAGCHADTAHMAPYDVPTDQYEKYRGSVHWTMLSDEGDLGAPTCNDCHGNHGAAPPGLSWVGNVCGQCHNVMAEMYDASRHSETFALLGVPGCAVCHRNHEIRPADDELLGLGENAICAECHTSADAGGRTATAMRMVLDSLERAYALADSILRQAENAGMEVSQAMFDLEAAHTALVTARATVHSFDVAAVREEAATGLEITGEVAVRGRDALDELRFRRLGLVASVTIIAVLILGLVLRIRQLERTRRPTPR